jgi:hypothetical protein
LRAPPCIVSELVKEKSKLAQYCGHSSDDEDNWKVAAVPSFFLLSDLDLLKEGAEIIK